MTGLRMIDDPPRPWRSRSFLAAGVVLAVVVVLGAWVVMSGQRTEAPRPPVERSATTPTARHHRPRSAPTPGPADAIPTSAPPEVTWRPYAGVLLPFSRVAGPRMVSGSLATGYAHTPTGALVAGVQIDYRHLIAPDWRAVTMAQVLAGPGRAAYLAARGDAPTSAGAPTPTYRQVAGFDVIDYRPSLAVIQLVTSGPNGTYQMVPITLAWSGGDWRQELTPAGGDGPTIETVASLAGFVPWAGG